MPKNTVAAYILPLFLWTFTYLQAETKLTDSSFQRQPTLFYFESQGRYTGLLWPSCLLIWCSYSYYCIKPYSSILSRSVELLFKVLFSLISAAFTGKIQVKGMPTSTKYRLAKDVRVKHKWVRRKSKPQMITKLQCNNVEGPMAIWNQNKYKLQVGPRWKAIVRRLPSKTGGKTLLWQWIVKILWNVCENLMTRPWHFGVIVLAVPANKRNDCYKIFIKKTCQFHRSIILWKLHKKRFNDFIDFSIVFDKSL